MPVQLSRKNRTRSRPQHRRPPPVTRIQWFDPTALSTREIAHKLERGKIILENTDAGVDRGTRVVVNDIADLLDDARLVVTEKNLGDSLNRIRSEVNQVVKKTRRRSKEMGRLDHGDKETFTDYQKDIREMVGQIRRLTEKMVMSAGFRSFLWKSFLLVRDTFGPVVQRGSERKAHRDQSAERVGGESERYGSGRDIEGDRKAYDVYEPQRASPNQTSERMRSTESGRVGNRDWSAERVGGKSERYGSGRDFERDRKAYDNYEPQRSSPRQTSERTRSRGSGRVDPQLIRRWKELIQDIRKDSSLKEAVEDMREMFSHMRAKYGPIAQRRRQTLIQRNRELTEEIDHDVMEIEYEARKLFERFTGRKMQPLINEMNALFVAIREDKQLSDWIQEMNALVGTIFTDTDLDEERFSAELDELIKRGQQIWGGKHKPLAQALLRETLAVFDGLSHDETLTFVRESLGRVMADLFLDTSGRFVLKPDLYAQLTDALRPAMAAMLKDIRIPHIYHYDEQMEFTLNDILVDISDFQPKQIKVSNIVDLALGKEDTGIHIEFRVISKGSTGAIRRMKFWYRRKAFPKLGDQGIVDAVLTGEGLSFDMDVEVKATREDILNLMTGQGERKSSEIRRPSDEYGRSRERGRGSFEEEKTAKRSQEERRRDSALLLKENERDIGQEYRYAGEMYDREGHRNPIYVKAGDIDDAKRGKDLQRRSSSMEKAEKKTKGDFKREEHAKSGRSLRQRSTSMDETRQMFRVKRVVVRCKTLRLNFRRANHKLLYKLATPFMIPVLQREIQNAIQENLYHFVGKLNQSMTTARGFAMKTVERSTGTRIVRGTDDVGRPLRRSASLRDKSREPRRESSEYTQGAESDRYREGVTFGYRERERDEAEGREVLAADEEKEAMAGHPRRNRKIGERLEEDEGVGFTEATVYERVKVVKGIPSSMVGF